MTTLFQITTRQIQVLGFQQKKFLSKKLISIVICGETVVNFQEKLNLNKTSKQILFFSQ